MVARSEPFLGVNNVIFDFEGLLRAAQSQPTAQRLLTVFVNAELTTFNVLVQASMQTGAEWVSVFVAALSGNGHKAPTTEDAQAVQLG
jgi:hypothetical protein